MQKKSVAGRRNPRVTPRNALSAVRRDYDLYLMLIPMILLFLLFSYRPMLSLVIAFKKYSPFRGIADSPWIGLEHFRSFFGNPYAWRVIRNTLVISLVNLFFGFPLPIIFALLLNELRARRFRKVVQTFSYIPHFISTVVVCGLVINFLSPSSGVVNSVIRYFGGTPKYFMSQASSFVPIYYLMEMWRTIGYSSIIYIAALTSISAELYEAATVDGAGRWRQFLNVTFPCLLPTIVVVLLVRLGTILNIGYEAIILLYNPSIYETADIINTYVYRVGILEGRYDFATAVSLLNSVVALILVVFANRVANKTTGTGLW